HLGISDASGRISVGQAASWRSDLLTRFCRHQSSPLSPPLWPQPTVASQVSRIDPPDRLVAPRHRSADALGVGIQESTLFIRISNVRQDVRVGRHAFAIRPLIVLESALSTFSGEGVMRNARSTSLLRNLVFAAVALAAFAATGEEHQRGPVVTTGDGPVRG